MNRFIWLVVLLFFVGCSKPGQPGTYKVIHKLTGKTYYLEGPPLHHEHYPGAGLPGQYDKNCYHFKYGDRNQYYIQLPKDQAKVIAPDGGVEDLGSILP